MSDKVFRRYAEYYNLLYKDKNYAEEAGYVHQLIQKNRPAAATVLNLGCGTGKHDFELATYGYQLTGVDLSEDMLQIANERLESQTIPMGSLSFINGDIRNVRLGSKFDAVISLFHVMSYQNSNADLIAAFATVRAHLNDDGVFVFDCWYGPAVLTDPPVTRVKRLENDMVKVLRIAEPIMHPNENIVDVNYQVFITDKTTGEMEEVFEIHRMRYLFVPELEYLLSEAGFTLMSMHEWMSEKAPSLSSWGACFVARLL